jgi:hypothetical protein
MKRLDLKLGNTVIVSDPKWDDLFNHSFQGTIVSIRGNVCTVIDQEENVFEIETRQIEVSE